ncbi:hypothetical protein [Absidia glauca]|uniref:Uncharacterized protein n=1 Tax=Absidia glauca TaxID=4829 RepID=A0A168QZJ9_ABSGL|nr:hypothetical protein [Absidia glauca]
MSDDTNDDFFIGPMPTTDQVTSILTTTEDMETSPPVDGYSDDQHDKPEEDDDNERTTVLMIHDKDDSFKLNSESINDDDSNSPDNRPPSPQPLFLRSGIGASLDGLEYDGVISQIAETNEVDKPWLELKVIIRSALLNQCIAIETVLDDPDVLSTINGIKTNILHCIDHHKGTPFSIQRLCELIRSPTRHYRLFIKYLHAIEKVLSVASTWESFYDQASTCPTDPQQPITDLISGYETPHITMSSIEANQGDSDGENDDLDDDQDDEIDDDDDNDSQQQHNNDTDIDTVTHTDSNNQQHGQDRNIEVDPSEEGLDGDIDTARADDPPSTTTQVNGHSNGAQQPGGDQVTNGSTDEENDEHGDDSPTKADPSLHSATVPSDEPSASSSSTSSINNSDAREKDQPASDTPTDSQHTTQSNGSLDSNQHDEQDRNGLADDKDGNETIDDIHSTGSKRRTIGSPSKQKHQVRSKRQKQDQATDDSNLP